MAVKLNSTAWRILEFVENNPNVTRGQICIELKIADSTAQMYLGSLREHGYIEKTGETRPRYTATGIKRTIREQAEPSDPAVARLIAAMNAMVAVELEVA